MRLTPRMRETLEQLAHEPARRVHEPGPGKPPWPHHPATLAALLRHGLVEYVKDRNRKAYIRETWTITDKGREALDPPARRRRSDRPRYLQRDVWRGGDYTTDPHRRIDELEVTDPLLLDHHPARIRHCAARDRKGTARQFARGVRAA